MKTQLKSLSGTRGCLKSEPKNNSPADLEARKTELDYMCTYMTWLTVKERYTKEMHLAAG